MSLLYFVEVANFNENLCEFWIWETLLNFSHEKLVNILGGHGIRINIHGCQPIL